MVMVFGVGLRVSNRDPRPADTHARAAVRILQRPHHGLPGLEHPTVTGPRGRTDALMVVPGLRAGGLERVALEVLRAASGQRRLHVIRFAPTTDEDLAPPEVPVESILRRPGLDLRFVAALGQRLRALRPRVVHLHNPTALFYGALAARLAPATRLVYTDHGQEDELSPPARRALRMLVPRSTTAVAVAHHVADRLVGDLGFARERVTVIPNGVEPGADREASTGAPLQIGTIARLSRAKDHRTILDGFAAFVRRAPKARLEFVGDGAERETLRVRARTLGIVDQVSFAGTQTDVRSRLRAMDIFVTASRTEGLPLAVLEAMAEGCAVVCSDIPGHRELVSDGTDGRLFPVGDAATLTDRLLELATSPSLRTRLSQAAQARQRQHYGLRRMLDAYLELYERLLA